MAFTQEQIPLSEEDLMVTFPHYRYESHQEEADVILQQHLVELLQE